MFNNYRTRKQNFQTRLLERLTDRRHCADILPVSRCSLAGIGLSWLVEEGGRLWCSSVCPGVWRSGHECFLLNRHSTHILPSMPHSLGHWGRTKSNKTKKSNSKPGRSTTYRNPIIGLSLFWNVDYKFLILHLWLRYKLYLKRNRKQVDRFYVQRNH